MKAERTPVEIRPATEEDVPLLLGLIKELAEYERLSHQVEADEKTLAESLFGRRPSVEALVLHWQGEPAGYCFFFHNFSTFAGRPGLYVEDIYVRPEFRRRGLGRAVFGYLARLAQKRGCCRLEFAVLDWNEPALSFYERLGAGPLPEWRLFRFDETGIARLAGN